MWLILMRKTVFVNICPALQLEQKRLFTPNPYFPLDFLLFKLVEKSNLSELLSERVTFFNKKRIFQWIYPKMLQNNTKVRFSCMWLTLRRKTVFVNICPVILIKTKRVVYNKSKFSSGLAPFQTCQEKQTFWVFQCFFLK